MYMFHPKTNKQIHTATTVHQTSTTTESSTDKLGGREQRHSIHQDKPCLLHPQPGSTLPAYQLHVRTGRLGPAHPISSSVISSLHLAKRVNQWLSDNAD
ncbi:hypothetical protein BaRGS_00028916 [Batillaria attramentaria]|uniref:Uncharacterized protein n=1 Tax=Batillaria attramentaria TaxID=370345 RepID=A0ABD0JYX5_9CAEN